MLTLLLAVIQFAAPAFASIAEGSFSRRVAGAQTHLESSGQNECTAPHSADCAVCRFIGGNAAAQLSQPAWAEFFAAVPFAATVLAAGSGPDRQGFDARGPPAIAG